ncbi:hypothetical protein BsWGS_22265 [Bradybaena similaris]
MVLGIILSLFQNPIFFTISSVVAESAEDVQPDDLLTPYKTHHGPLHRRHRETQACQSVKYRNVTHTKHRAQAGVPVLPLFQSHHIVKEIGSSSWDKKLIYVNHQIVNNPLTTWSVLEPGHPGTCQNGSAERATVQTSSQQKQCLVAANAGFFNTHTGECLGNIVSDGFLVRDSGGIQNAHFGITKDGFIYTGYLSELDLVLQDFTQLVGGVVWLVRDGENYVDESKAIECSDTEETGAMERFVTVISGRTAVGHDAQGRIHMVQVNGKTDVAGVDLHKFAGLLIELGLVNAINLDGGGSTTTLINGTLVNYPSDQCTNSSYNCQRQVSTILCVHPPSCSQPDCSGHGSCQMGVCQCRGRWTGLSCDRLECPDDCSWRGQCTEEGCICEAGWSGDNCAVTCDKGWYGANCSLPCACDNGAVCNSVTGACVCLSGYRGRFCQSECPAGYFGPGCREVCVCRDSCLCDAVTGDCNVTLAEPDLLSVGVCLAKQEIHRKHLIPDKRQQYDLCVVSVLVISLIATVSLLVNILLTFTLLKTRREQRATLKSQLRLAVKNTLMTMKSAQRNSDSDDEDDDANTKQRYSVVLHDVENDDGKLTGSGEEEQDLFLAPKNVKRKVKK